MNEIALAVHGGAGTILKANMTRSLEIAYTKGLEEAISVGQVVLKNKGTAVEAVQSAVQRLEDIPLFNAGKGSVFTAEGGHEMDASIMDGRTRDAGAVTGIQGIKNPILLAGQILKDPDFVLLSGEGALEYALGHGFEITPDDYFFNKYRHDQWLEVKDTGITQLDHTPPQSKGPSKFGTVGAVALDYHGSVAAATSTGGLTNKKYGRVGDSPLIGSGNYANDLTCAISCTGNGEFFIRGVVAYDISCLIEYRHHSLQEACEEVIHKRLRDMNGGGGVIGIDASGEIAMVFNSEGMYRASWKYGDEIMTAIYK